MGIECWLCSTHGERQIELAPEGLPDGRKVCLVCVRRLIGWLHRQGTFESDRLPAVWLRARSSPAQVAGEEWREAVREAFTTSIRGSLPKVDDPTRASAAIAYLEMGLFREGLEALASVDPATIEAEGLPDRLLISLLTRLFDEGVLAPRAREELESALYSKA